MTSGARVVEPAPGLRRVEPVPIDPAPTSHAGCDSVVDKIPDLRVDRGAVVAGRVGQGDARGRAG